MRLTLFALAISVGVGYLFGGRITRLSALRIRWTGLALVGLALQFVTGPGDTFPLLCLYVSFVLLAVFAIKNLRVVGFPLVLIGILLNFSVIALNHGMPVSWHALEASGQASLLDDLVHDPYPKHHLASPGDPLVFLGDVIPLAPPIRQAISVGDIFTYGGVAVVIVFGMRAPEPARREDEEEAALVDDREGVPHAGG